jgi:O-antigen ligase
VLSTLIFFLPLSDAANLPKLFLYSSLTIFVFCTLLISTNFINLKISTLIPIFLVFISLILTLLIHDNKYLALFGNVGRLNGFLNFLGLFSFLVGAILLRKKHYIIHAILYLGIFQSIYALMQIYKIDPIIWSNPYGKAIGTLANTDFLSAFIGISSTSIFYFYIKASKQKKKLLITIWAFEFMCLINIGAYQGPILSILGVLGYALIYAQQKRRKPVLLAASVSLGFTFLGIFGIGPLSFLNKFSIQLRGDYWRAASRAIEDNPIFGFGYGGFQDIYRTYRDLKSINRRGPSYIADSAHSIFLDYAVFGGIILLGSILILFSVALISSLKSFKTKNEFFDINVFFSVAALLYFAQGLISIDALGLSSWGWAAIGCLYGNLLLRNSVALKTQDKTPHHLVGLLVAVSVSSILFRNWIIADIDSKKLMNWYAEAKVNNGKVNSIDPIINLEKTSSGIPVYMNEVALAYLSLGDFEKGSQVLSKVILMFPDNYDAWFYTAANFELNGKTQEAVEARLKLKKIDPFNLENRLKLVRNLVSVGNVDAAKVEVSEMKRISINSREVNEALALL